MSASWLSQLLQRSQSISQISIKHFWRMWEISTFARKIPSWVKEWNRSQRAEHCWAARNLSSPPLGKDNLPKGTEYRNIFIVVSGFGHRGGVMRLVAIHWQGSLRDVKIKSCSCWDSDQNRLCRGGEAFCWGSFRPVKMSYLQRDTDTPDAFSFWSVLCQSLKTPLQNKHLFHFPLHKHVQIHT